MSQPPTKVIFAAHGKTPLREQPLLGRAEELQRSLDAMVRTPSIRPPGNPFA